MGKRQRNRLTALEVVRQKQTGKHGDGGGLYLVIDDLGRRRWVFIYTMAGKRREMGLGAASGPDVVTLADARAAASAANTLKRQGIDPLDHKKSKVEAIASLKGAAQRESNVPIFGVYADAYVDRHQSAWRNDKHIAQWKTSLTQHCQPLRHRRIDDIDTQAVMSVLQPLWTKVPETAQRLRGRIERVLDAAKVEGHRSGENPARWRGHLQALLPKRQKLTRGHHAALPFDRISELMRGLRERQTVSVRLLEFCILTATRSGEARNAQKSEFDLDRAVWTIPPHRMKTGREHRVPLSDRAVEILKEMGRMKTSPFLFPSAKGGSMSYMAMTSVLKRHGYGHVTVHGFRSTFRDWASETTSFPLEVCEMALAHAITNKAEAAYRRGDLFEKRRELMAAWAAYCEAKTENVVPLHRAAS